MEDYNRWVIKFGKIYRYSEKVDKDEKVYKFSEAIEIVKELGREKRDKRKNRKFK